MNKLEKKYLFIDESGDAAFYAGGKKLLVGKEGFQPLLLLGLICVALQPFHCWWAVSVKKNDGNFLGEK